MSFGILPSGGPLRTGQPVQGRGDGWSGWSLDRDGWTDTSDPLFGHTSRLCWFWGILVRIVLLESGSWWGMVLYIIYQWGFLWVILQGHRSRCPRSSMTWTDTYTVKFRQPDDLFHTLKTNWELLHLVPPRFHGTVGMVSYTHVVYVKCYFWYMLFNTYLCMYIILLWTGGGT